MKRRILCLLLVLLQAGMVACGNAEGGPDSGETKSADVQTENGTESETEEVDPFAGFNYDGKDFRIYTSTNIAAVSLGNSNYMIEGPEELTGDAAPDAAYERNLAVEDLLNVHFTYEHLDNRYDQVNATIKKYITAGEDAYDLIINDMYGLSPLTLEGMFYNILDGKYFDFSKPWWYDDFMSDVAINSNYQYMLGGDYFIDILRCSHCLFYNKSLYEKMTGDGEGLYDVVLAGDWTFDAFNTLVEESYVDLNGDGKKDTGDQFGYAAFETWGPMIPFLISADPGYIARRSDGYPEITINNEKGVYLLDQLTGSCAPPTAASRPVSPRNRSSIRSQRDVPSSSATSGSVLWKTRQSARWKTVWALCRIRSSMKTRKITSPAPTIPRRSA